MSFIKWLNENRLWGLIITIIIIALISVTYWQEKQYETGSNIDEYGFYSRMEFPLIDMRHRLLSQTEKPSDDIVIVTLTESAIDRYKDEWGRWPWPREVIASVIGYLRHANTIMLDFGFLEPSGKEIKPKLANDLKLVTQQAKALTESKPKKAEELFNAVINELDRLSLSDDQKLGQFSKAYGPTHHVTWFSVLEDQVPNKSTLDTFEKIFANFGYKIIGGEKIFPIRSYLTAPIKPIIDNSYALAHIVFTPDPDGPARRFDPFIGMRAYPSKGFEPARPFLPILGVSGALQELGYSPKKSEFKVTERTLQLEEGFEIPLDRKNKVLIKYRGALQTSNPLYNKYEEVPIEKILPAIISGREATDAPPPEFFKGKNVFLGTTATALHDLRATPFTASEAGVAIHANIFDMFVNKDFLEPIRATETIVAIVGLTATVGVIAMFLSPMIALTLTVLLTSLYVITGMGLYNQGHLINLSAPLISSYLTYGLVLVYNLVFEQRKRQQVKNAFQHYLTASVMEEILKDPDKLELGGERREISVLFADIAGFTTFSEGRTATEVASVINKILTEMTECIFRYEGVLDKYIGDEMVAEFGIIPVEPEDHARRAVNAAVDMRLRMKELREKWREEGHSLLQLRIGVHTGVAATGNMGSEMLFDFTALGDNVNLGSRLEGANKQYNTLSMISEVTYQNVKDDFEVREIDNIIVKGKDEPITVYELLGRPGEVESERLDLRDRFEEALQLYRNKQWDEAIERFESIVDDFPDDGPSPIFKKRCEEFKEEPPAEDWDGVYRLTSK